MKSSIQALIEQNGPLPFAEFMSLALYAPGQSYYARGLAQVGRSGDFYTSVSVGECFGQLLARHMLKQWRQLGMPNPWRITECGAHDGTLARDILDSLSSLDRTAYETLEYAIVEPLANLRAAQTDTLSAHGRRVHHAEDAASLEPLPGVVFGNEVLDALPCHLIEWKQGGWQQCMVTVVDGELAWSLQPITDLSLITATRALGEAFPEGYRSEVRTCYESFLQPLTRSLSNGILLWIDYGFERAEYYHPDRRQGTLRTFEQHRAGENPLDHPGELDITAHVDFTAVAQAASKLGGKPKPLISQGNWLTHHAKEWLLAQEGNPDPMAMRQFQSLTHPGHLGRVFQVLEVEFG